MLIIQALDTFETIATQLSALVVAQWWCPRLTSATHTWLLSIACYTIVAWCVVKTLNTLTIDQVAEWSGIKAMRILCALTTGRIYTECVG